MVDAQRSGIIYTGEKFKEIPKIIRLVKSNCVDENGEAKSQDSSVVATFAIAVARDHDT